MQDGLFLLGLLQLIPIIGAIGLMMVRRDGLAWGVGMGCLLAEFGLAMRLYQLFDPLQSGMQWILRMPIINSWLVYVVGADGITVLFVVLTAFLCPLVAIYGGHVRKFQPLSRYLAAILATEAALIGQFVTLDLLWFTLMNMAHTLLVGYLFMTWSLSVDEWQAVNRYAQFQGTSLLLLLAAVLMLGWHHADLSGGEWSFERSVLMGDNHSLYFQTLIFYLLFYGLAIRVPLFPLHGWLPIVMEHGTVATGIMLLLGLKTGIYGMLRFIFPMFPDAVVSWHKYVIAVATIGIFYSALLALIQNNMKKLLAYAVISHTGILIIGLFSLHPQAFQGSIILTGTFGVAISTLLLMAGIVHQRTHSMVLTRLGGLFYPMPLVGLAFLVAGLAIVGMPLTPGFDAVHLVLEAAIERFGALVTVTAAVGNVAAASCLLWAFQRAFLATPIGFNKIIPKATLAESGVAMILIAVQLISGFYTDPWLDLVKQSAQSLAMPYTERLEHP